MKRDYPRHGKKVLMLASVASMIDQFNMPNIRLLQDMGYEVHVACNFMEGNTCDSKRIRKLRNTLSKIHVEWHQWECPRSIYSVRRCWVAFWQLWALTGQYHFEWLHCHSPVGGALARIAAYGRKIGVIYTAHGFHFYKGAPLGNWLLYYPVEKLLSYLTDVLVTVNKEDYYFAKNNFKAGKVCRIPGVGIPVEKYKNTTDAAIKSGQQVEKPERKNKSTEMRRKYGIPPDAEVLLSVGELSRRKNHRDVIAALAGLMKQGENVFYMICGQGKLKKRLMRYAKRLGVADRICMPGFLEQMDKVYQEADLFVFPSYQEGMPAALMEAMAAGLPCVVSDIRGNRELIDDRSFRFIPGHVEELQTILERLIKDEKLRNICSAYNQKKICAYSLLVVQKRMLKIYQWMEEAR